MTFPVIKSALNDAPAMLFVTLRMLCVVPILVIYLKATHKSFWFPFNKHGWGLIISYTIGFILQTYGLQHTTASRSGFLTSLYVIWVPFLSMRIAREKAPKVARLAIPLAVIGTALMMRLDIGGRWNIGDWLTIACAVSFAFQIVWTSRIGNSVHPFTMVLYPSLFTGLVSLPLLFTFHREALAATNWSTSLWVAVAYTTICGSIIAMGVMNKYQPKTKAVTASLIYTGEPVFAAIFATLWFGEHLTGYELAGGIMILLANVVAQIPFKKPHIVVT